MSAVAMSATTTAAVAATAGFFARGSIIAGTGGGEGGKFFVQLGGTAARAFRSAPIGRADKDFAVASARLTMKFVNRHMVKVVGAWRIFKFGKFG
jgi:hypothetical protein